MTASRRRSPRQRPAPRAGAGCRWCAGSQDCRKDSVPLVGGKCASLGELINAGVRVPPGFALTTEGYRRFMGEAGIAREVQALLQGHRQCTTSTRWRRPVRASAR